MGRVDAISRRLGNKEVGGFEQLLVEGKALLLEEQEELEPLEGLDISGWKRS